MAAPRVLSIQSHTVGSRVGNAAAVFPLQRLGIEVDALHSVNFSNHTGYPAVAGERLTAPALASLVGGLEANGLAAGYSHLLTGYLPSLELLRGVAAAAARMREANPGLVFVCDPVMGDGGKLYVAPDMPAAFRAQLVPLASVLTPNQFEAELLTGAPIRGLADAAAACTALHALGPHTVVLTSLDLADDSGGEGGGDGARHPSPHLTLLASTTLPQPRGGGGGGGGCLLRLRVPRLEGYFTGAGDLLAALLLAWLHRGGGDLASALEKAAAGLHAVLEDTAGHAAAVAAPPGSAAAWAARELRLVQNQAALAEPVVRWRAEVLDPAALRGVDRG